MSTAADMPAPPPPGAGLNLQDPGVVEDLFLRAAAANLESPLRKGATVHMPTQGRLIVSGDLHDNGLNLQRILKLAALHESRDNYLIIQEVVHGPSRVNGRDFSIRMLARVAAAKLAFPGQLFLLQSNHELAQVGGEGILKDGISVVESFNDGVEFIYGDDAPRVNDAMVKYIRSLLLAVIVPASGIMCCHSLPSPRRYKNFDPDVIHRLPSNEDLSAGGSGYDLVWGRNHSQELTDELAAKWGVKVFLCGHQPAEMGYEIQTRNMIVLASDHDHGMAVSVALNKKNYDVDSLIDQIVPLASVVL